MVSPRTVTKARFGESTLLAAGIGAASATQQLSAHGTAAADFSQQEWALFSCPPASEAIAQWLVANIHDTAKTTSAVLAHLGVSVLMNQNMHHPLRLCNCSFRAIARVILFLNAAAPACGRRKYASRSQEGVLRSE